MRDTAVLTAWRGSLDVYDQASITPNPNDPALGATHMDPQLTVARQSLAAMIAAHESAAARHNGAQRQRDPGVSDRG